MRSDEALALALDWAKKGLHVFPIGSDKQPLCKGGFLAATTNEAALRGLFQSINVECGVGVYPGRAGYVVLDVDVKDGKQGAAEFRKLQEQRLTANVAVRTPSGGLHLWYRKPAGAEYTNSSLGADASIDIRADGGYVVLPGTYFGDKKYEWHPDSRGLDEATEIPTFLAEQLRIKNVGVGYTALDLSAFTDADREAYEYLRRLGFHSATAREGSIDMTRPDKVSGNSVSIGKINPGVIHFFTTDATLPDGRLIPANSTFSIDEFKVFVEHNVLPENIQVRFGNPSGNSNAALESSKGPAPVMNQAAFYGLMAEAVQLFDHTEADPNAILLALLTGFGNLVGDKPYVELVSGIKQYARLNTVIVGASAKARKSAAWSLALSVLERIDDGYVDKNIMGGFGSGHILVDTLAQLQPQIKAEEMLLVQDKRILIFEDEFVRILKTVNSDNSIYSAVLRSAYDGSKLEVRSRQKTSVVPKGEHHISIVGLSTAEELNGSLSRLEAYNGFGNRLLFVWARRVKSVAFSEVELNEAQLTAISTQLRAHAEKAQSAGRIQLSEDAKKLWTKVYEEIQDDEPGGVLGALTSRGDVYVIRLALIYALADGSQVIHEEHIRAGAAVWEFCRATVAHIVPEGRAGIKTPDNRVMGRLADKVYQILFDAGEEGLGMTKLKARAVSHSNASYFDDAITYLEANNKVRKEYIRTSKTGISALVYFAVKELT